MGFHNTTFPDNIAYGSRGGPGYKTQIIITDSGQEERVARWSEAQRKYNVRYGLRRYADLTAVHDFYIARLGPANTFRFKDFFDFTSAADHKSATTYTDQQIGVGDGTTKKFQLKKTYTEGSESRVRNIFLPRASTVSVSIDDVDQSSGWTVNDTTGEVTFTTAPALNEVIKAGFEFDTPVRFGIEMDDDFSISIDAFEAGDIPDILLVEDKNPLAVPEEFYHGGAIDHGQLTANISVTVSQGRCHRFTLGSASLEIELPPYALLAPGGPYFYFFNDDGADTVTIKNHLGTTVGTIGPNSSAVIVLGLVSSTKTWKMS